MVVKHLLSWEVLSYIYSMQVPALARHTESVILLTSHVSLSLFMSLSVTSRRTVQKGSIEIMGGWMFDQPFYAGEWDLWLSEGRNTDTDAFRPGGLAFSRSGAV